MPKTSKETTPKTQTPPVEEIVETLDPSVEAVELEIETPEAVKSSDNNIGIEDKRPKTRRCQYCQSKTSPTYTDSASLKKFLSDRIRILPKSRTGLCSKHQRRLSTAIKRARHLALLPFTPSI